MITGEPETVRPHGPSVQVRAFDLDDTRIEEKKQRVSILTVISLISFRSILAICTSITSHPSADTHSSHSFPLRPRHPCRRRRGRLDPLQQPQRRGAKVRDAESGHGVQPASRLFLN